MPKNPRFIKDARFAALVKSINDAPEMLKVRELMVVPHGNKYVVVGGNMRLRACKELGFKEVPCKVLAADTPVEKLREYAMKDNEGYGQTDWDIIANEWDDEELEDWGIEIPTDWGDYGNNTANDDGEDDDGIDLDDDDEEDDLSEAINKKNAKKRISPNFVKRVGKTAGQGADECINIQHTFDEKIAEIDAQIKAAKTPKDADDAVKAEYNEKRKALRKEKKQLELERDTNANKAEAFERACDGYCDIYTLLTGKELDVRKTERLNPFVPLTEEMELEVLNSLWADKNARRSPKKNK